MTKFDIGQHVIVNSTGKTGVVEAIYDNGYIGYGTYDGVEYAVRFDDGSGVSTLTEGSLERVKKDEVKANKCTCGAWITSFSQIHSPWCPQYK